MRETLNKQFKKSQNGFRKERSCQDHTFTLKQISEKTHGRAQEIYMGFVEILKAFDSVPRKQIWQILRKREIKT